MIIINAVYGAIGDACLMNRTLKEKILSFDRPVPRYTSYPTAPHFTPVAGEGAFGYAPDQDQVISLYLHIPFCHQMCWYCGCHTKATQQYSPVARYVELLLQEISLLAR